MKTLLAIAILFLAACGDNIHPPVVEDDYVGDPAYPPLEDDVFPPETDPDEELRGCEHGQGDGKGRCHGKGKPE